MFLVEVHDPYSEHPHLTDEEFRCERPEQLAERLEEVLTWPWRICLYLAREIADGGEGFRHETDEGVEVTAHRVGELVGGARS